MVRSYRGGGLDRGVGVVIIMTGIRVSISLPVLKDRSETSQPPVLDTCSDDNDGYERRERKFAGQAYLKAP